MEIDQLLSRLAVALGIGLLIGLERAWRTREATPGSRAAGIRTFALSGLLGGIVAALARATGSAEGAGLMLGFGFAVYAAVAALFERDATRAAGAHSATSIVAAMLAFALGAYAVLGEMRVAAAVAVAATGILAAREDIHSAVARLTWPELRSVLVLLAMSVIVLPVLPDTNVGPGDGVNLREIWLIAIVLAAVSFVGYAAVKAFGATHGILLAAFAGGLVSSTAVTATSARRAAAGEAASHLLAAGVAAATAVSLVRVIVIVAVLKSELLGILAPALTAATVVAAAYALLPVYWRAGGNAAASSPPAEFRNPFSFWPVVGFAIFLGAVILLGRAIGETFGANGALLGAIGLGLADVDAVTISIAHLVPAPLSAFAAGTAILAAVASNMVAKLVIAVFTGAGRFALAVSAMTTTCWLAAGAAFWAARALAGG